jgi:peptidyl-prolyl cis-trans isomerase D
MLQAIRNHTTGLLARLLFVLLIASFAIWGIADIISSGFGQVTVARIGSKSIHLSEFRQSLELEISRLQAVSPQPISIQTLKSQGALSYVTDMILTRSIMAAYTQHAGILPDAASVALTIVQEPALRDANGQFDPSKLSGVLSRLRLSEQDYADQVGLNLAVTRLNQAVGSVLQLPDSLVRSIAATSFQQRKIEYVRLPISAVKAAAPTEAEMLQFYQEKPDFFLERDYRAISMIKINSQAVASQLPVSEDAVAAAYQQQLSAFKVPEQRTVVQLLFADADKAKQAYEALQAQKTTSSEAAKKIAQDHGGKVNDLGRVSAQDLLPQLADAAFKDGVGVRAPVESPLGWVVLSVQSITPPRTQELKEVRQQLRDGIAARDATRMISELQTRIEDTLAGGGSLEEVAKLSAQPIVRLAKVDRWGKDDRSQDIANFPNTDRVRDAVYSTTVGQMTNLTLDDGTFLVMRVDQEIPTSTRPYAKVRDEIVQLLTKQKLQTAAEAKLQTLLTQARSGTTLASLAASEGGKTDSSNFFTQQDNPLELPPELVMGLFTAANQDLITGQDQKSLWLVRLTGIREFTPDDQPSPTYKQLTEQLTTSLQKDVTDALQQDIRKTLGVTINDAALINL